MKHNYQTPAMRVIELKQRYSILDGSRMAVKSVNGNVFSVSAIESDEDYEGEIR